VFPSDEVISRGHPARPPRFYEKLFEEAHGDIESVKRKRRAEAAKHAVDCTDARLRVRERVHLARGRMLKRSIEDAG